MKLVWTLNSVELHCICRVLLYYRSLYRLPPPMPLPDWTSFSLPPFYLFVCSLKIPHYLSLALSVSTPPSLFRQHHPSPLYRSVRTLSDLSGAVLAGSFVLWRCCSSSTRYWSAFLSLCSACFSSEETRECAHTSCSQSLTFFQT